MFLNEVKHELYVFVYILKFILFKFILFILCMIFIYEKHAICENMEDMIPFLLLLFNNGIDQNILTSHSKDSHVKHCMQITYKTFVKRTLQLNILEILINGSSHLFYVHPEVTLSLKRDLKRLSYLWKRIRQCICIFSCEIITQ